MINILIVEDEPLVRLGIKTSLLAHPNVINVIGEAENGFKAMELINDFGNKIDLVLSDIRMPSMDGLELTKRIRENFPVIKVIILSSYNEIHYVRDAIKAGASDYLLKYEVDENNILLFLQKIFPDLQLENNHDEADLAEECISKSIILDRLSNLKKCHLKFETAISFQEKNQKFTISLFIKNYMELIAETYQGRVQFLESSLCNILDEYLRQRCNAEYYKQRTGHYVLFLENNQNNQYLLSSIEVIGEILKKYLNISSDIGISEVYYSDSEIKTSYDQAIRCVHACFFLGEEKFRVLHYGEISKDLPYDRLDEKYQEILKNIKGDKPAQVKFALMDYFQVYENTIGLDREILTNHLNRISKEIWIMMNSENCLDLEYGGQFDLSDKQSFEELKSCFLERLEVYFSRNKPVVKKPNLHIEKAIVYIEKNLSNENLSLGLLSDYLNVNKSYFSRLFKQETGLGFVEYVSKRRIEHAIELMKNQSSQTLKAISRKCGFANYNHFCQTFKKFTNKLPSEFYD